MGRGGCGRALFNLCGVQVMGVAALILAVVESMGIQVCVTLVVHHLLQLCVSWWREDLMMLLTDIPSTRLALSECCSLRECSHHPAVYLQKPDAAGQVGCSPFLGF